MESYGIIYGILYGILWKSHDVFPVEGFFFITELTPSHRMVQSKTKSYLAAARWWSAGHGINQWNS